jgi:hypothetical protein
MPGANNKHDKFGGARARSPAYIILNERGRINHSRAGQKAAKTHHDKLAGAHTIFSVIEWGARAERTIRPSPRECGGSGRTSKPLNWRPASIMEKKMR